MKYFIDKFLSRRLIFAIILLVVVIGVSAAIIFNLFFRDVYKGNKYIEFPSEEYKTAIRKADSSILSDLPPANSIKPYSKEGARKLFDLAHLTYSFRLADKAVGYLIRLLDSNSQAAEPFKSIAAFSLVHTYYDTGGDIKFMADAVESSKFMREIIKPKAERIFPGLFTIPLNKMTYSEKTLYHASYLIALSDREDSVAIPANAALGISRVYIPLYTNNPYDSKIAVYEKIFHEQLNIAINRLNERLSPNYNKPISAHDTVAGLNLLSLTIDYLRQYSLKNKYPEITDIDIIKNFSISYEIAKAEVPSLKNFTTYLYALYLAKYSENNAENNAQIDLLMQDIIGKSPFTGLNQYSWATKRLIGSKSNSDYNNFYRRENIATIARRSPLMREFLILKDGWTEKDFELRDNFKK